MFKRSLTLVVCLAVFVGCFTLFPSATAELPDYLITKEDWDARWNDFGNLNTNVSITPGADETKLNFAWHAPAGAVAPVVKLSRSADMGQPRVFSGYLTDSYDGYKTCRVIVSGIEANTTYYYTYGTGNLVYGPYLYRSLGFDNFKFLYINDMHAGYNEDNPAVGRDKAYKIHRTLYDAVTKNPGISFMIAGGDQTDSGQRPEEWNGLLATPILRSLPAAYCIGNHDKKGITQKHYIYNPNEYNALLPSPVGKSNWFRYGDVLFLIFDSTNGNATDHLNFARNAINQNLDAKWRIGVLHNDMNGPSFGFLDLDNNLIRTIFTTVVDRAGLDVVLTGHSHIYGRSHHLKNNRIVDWACGKEITDPKGTVYLSMSAVNNVASQTLPWQNLWTAKRCRDDITTYSTIEFADNRLVFKAFYVDGGQADEYTIIKTAFDPQPFAQSTGIDFYKIVQLAGTIYTLIDMANHLPA